MDDVPEVKDSNSITFREAVRWCQKHGVGLSFQPCTGVSARPAHVYMQEVRTMNSFLEAVQNLKNRHRKDKMLYDKSIKDVKLLELSFDGYCCPGRIERLAKVIKVKTVGQLLEWAAQQPEGLMQITNFPNVGEKTLNVLIKALKREGVERFPVDQNGRFSPL